LKYSTFTVAILANLLVAGNAFSNELNESAPQKHVAIEIESELSFVQKGIAQPGTEIHNWMKANFDAVSDFHAVSYYFEYPRQFGDITMLDLDLRSDDSDRLPDVTYLESYQQQRQKSKASSKIESFGGDEYPLPPASGGPGETWSWGSDCFNTGLQGYAKVSITYTWRNQDDTDGDGIADANPGWVITSESIVHYQPNQTPPACL